MGDVWPGVTEAQFALAMETGQSRLSASALVARGYCGWLLTNPIFLAEHEELLAKHQPAISQYGLGAAGALRLSDVPDARELGLSPAPNDAQALAHDLSATAVRWQLEGFAGPYLPLPLRPQVPLLSLDLVTHVMQSGGSMMYLPYIYPVPSRDELG
jgi:hypothetical protein